MKDGIAEGKPPSTTARESRIRINSIDMITIEVESESVIEDDEEVFGKKVRLFSRIFGCRHKRMSKPVTIRYISYKYCSNCGIRREYDPVTFRSKGTYYYPPVHDEVHIL